MYNLFIGKVSKNGNGDVDTLYGKYETIEQLKKGIEELKQDEKAKKDWTNKKDNDHYEYITFNSNDEILDEFCGSF